ncbi:hypothetical protein, partial [Microvirga aerophila]|uniref:hypothetical protein n=1 Tax=Microvirga aerophila TaxID=670291 RepID=UPI001AED74A9
MLDRVAIHLHGDAERVEVECHWAGGAVTWHDAADLVLVSAAREGRRTDPVGSGQGAWGASADGLRLAEAGHPQGR